MARFKNKLNGHEEESHETLSFVWCFLFGCFYFAFKGNWTHAFASFILALFTLGVSWFIYPFFVYRINDAYYDRQGWVRVKTQGDTWEW